MTHASEAHRWADQLDVPPHPDRPPLWPDRAAPAGAGLSAGSACSAGAQERLAVGRSGRRRTPDGVQDFSPAALGCRCGARRPAGLRGRAPGRSGRRAGARRDRLSQEGDKSVGRAAPVLRHRRPDRELPDRRVSRLCQPARPRPDRPRPVPARGLGQRCGPACGPGCRRSVVLRHQAEAGRAMLARAFAAGVPCAWVAGDSVYGADYGAAPG